MTSSPSDTETTVHPLQDFADQVAAAVGGTAEINFDTVKVTVAPESWVDAHRTARDDLDLVFFSWLSAIDWANDVESGEPLTEEIEERTELMTTVGDLSEGRRVTFSTTLPKEAPSKLFFFAFLAQCILLAKVSLAPKPNVVATSVLAKPNVVATSVLGNQLMTKCLSSNCPKKHRPNVLASMDCLDKLASLLLLVFLSSW